MIWGADSHRHVHADQRADAAPRWLHPFGRDVEQGAAEGHWGGGDDNGVVVAAVDADPLWGWHQSERGRLARASKPAQHRRHRLHAFVLALEHAPEVLRRFVDRAD